MQSCLSHFAGPNRPCDDSSAAQHIVVSHITTASHSTARSSTSFPMKTTILCLLPLLLATTGRALDAVAPDAKLADAPSFSIAERGPHHRVVQTATPQTGADGATTYRTNIYTELASGMHYLNNGQWVETQEVIEVAADGSSAFAQKGPH